MKKWLILGILGLGGVYGKRALDMANNLEVDIVPKLPQFKGLTLKIVVDILLKNPTNGSLKLKYPNAKLFLKSRNGELISIGHSDPVQKNLKIHQYSILKIESFTLNIPLMNLAAAAADIWDYIQGKSQALPLVAEIKTTLYPFGIPIPVTQRKEFAITKQPNHAG
ncbi:MAG: hypothetical protein H6581_20600 [Bacteroidia bacterium]|nr:hypothetical protein [Bacteroidia bacterium]